VWVIYEVIRLIKEKWILEAILVWLLKNIRIMALTERRDEKEERRKKSPHRHLHEACKDLQESSPSTSRRAWDSF